MCSTFIISGGLGPLSVLNAALNVVCHGSEQLQVGENLNKTAWRAMSQIYSIIFIRDYFNSNLFYNNQNFVF